MWRKLSFFYVKKCLNLIIPKMFSHAVEMHKSVLKRSDNGEQSLLKIDIQDQINFKGTVVNWALTS